MSPPTARALMPRILAVVFFCRDPSKATRSPVLLLLHRAGAVRSDTVSVTENLVGGAQAVNTFTFAVAGTNSPGYTTSRPTSISTWPLTVVTPDLISSAQAMAPAGNYASAGLDDGSVQTSYVMPSYSPSASPVALDYNSLTADPQPIFLARLQVPSGASSLTTVAAQLTFNGTALTTIYYKRKRGHSGLRSTKGPNMR